MRALVFSIFGAVLAGILCNLIFWGIGQLAVAFDVRLFNGEDESARNFLLFLVAFFVFIVLGGIYGYRVASRKNT